MHEWKVIPSFSDYEMNVLGDIRHRATESWVDQYLGRANFHEEKHLRVRLRREGLPIANSVLELLYETYPHLIPKADEPEPIVEKAKPVRNPNRWKRKTPKKPAGRAKPYVDDLGPEWKSIPGFSRYKINREGKVINRRSKECLTLRNSNKGSPNYSLMDDHGVSKARHPERLLGMVFKDYEHKDLRKSAMYIPKGDWTQIPSRSLYAIHISGEVRRTTSRHRVTVREDYKGRKVVKLKTDGVKGFKEYYVSDLLREVYGIQEEAA